MFKMGEQRTEAPLKRTVVIMYNVRKWSKITSVFLPFSVSYPRCIIKITTSNCDNEDSNFKLLVFISK